MTAVSVPKPHQSWGKLEWRRNPPFAEWDHALAALDGHPLQSSLWSRAQSALNGIVEHRWLALLDGAPLWMIRIEERNVIGRKVGWAPRGPTGRTPELSLSAPPDFGERLRAEGFSLLVTDPWVDAHSLSNIGASSRSRPQTIWLDLSLGKDVIFQNFHKNVRNGVRRASRGGVHVEITRDPAQLTEFTDLCAEISVQKGFELRVTSGLLDLLLNRSTANQDAEAVQFVAVKDGKFGAGLLIFRIGRSVHLIGAATNRELSQDRVGEACHWAVIEWAIARGCTRYDLEGIDRMKNQTGYEFKRRLGGSTITLPGREYIPLDYGGRLMGWLLRLRSNA